MSRARSRVAATTLLLPGLCLATAAGAREHDEDWQPEWLAELAVGGKEVTTDGSTSKQLEDHNLQDGADGRIAVDSGWMGLRRIRVDSAGQTGEEQGYLRANFEDLGRFGVQVDVESWREFYNSATGTPENSAEFFAPFTNDGKAIYGDDEVYTDWTRAGALFEGRAFDHDLFGEFRFRRVDGDQTLLKGGTVGDPAFIVGGSGPGTILFDLPSRKEVEYDSYMGRLGANSGLGDVNWQLDLRYDDHRFESDLREANFGTVAGVETESFRENTDLRQGRASLSGARNLRPGVFVFGAYSFDYADGEPEPEQFVETGSGSGFVQTRRTLSSDVERMGHSLNAGTVLQPNHRLTLRVDGRGRLSSQEADLDQFRNESAFATGNVGTVRNESERDALYASGRVRADFDLMPRVRLSGHARYDYRMDEVESARFIDFVPAEPAEIEEYENTSHEFRAGPKLRWRLRRGRSVEAGYEFRYRDISVDVDQVSTQLVLGDTESARHEAWVEAGGRIAGGVRGQIRAEYMLEDRVIDDPFINPVGIAASSDGEVQVEGWSVAPMVFYQPNRHWNVHASGLVAQREYELSGGGPTPAGFGAFAGFEYAVLTKSVSAGVGYSPDQRWSGQLGYSFYHNSHRSLGNQGHQASLAGSFRITDHWSVEAGYRYLHYDLDDTSVDDYRTHVGRVGLRGEL